MRETTVRIRKVFVSPDHARQGLGRKLLDHVEGDIKKSNLKDIIAPR